MSNKTRLQRCQSDLTRRAQTDPFLGVVDQRPEVTRVLAELSSALTREEDKIRDRIRKIVDEMRTGIDDLSEVVNTTRTTLTSGFKPLQVDWPPADQVLQDISQLLEKNEHHLSLRLRPRLSRVLDRAGPHHHHLQSILDELGAVHEQVVKNLPESVALLMAKQADTPFEEGRSVYELAVAPRLDELCRTRFFARLRYRRLRRRLKRQYQLLSVPLRDMVREGVVQRSLIVPAKLIRRHESTHHELQTQLNDSWRSIRYSLETAAIEFDDLREQLTTDAAKEAQDKPTELVAMVNAALDKASATLGDVTDSYATILNGFLEEIAQDHRNAVEAIHKGIEEVGSLRGRLRWAGRTLYQNLHRRRHALKARLTQRMEWLTGYWRRATALANRWILWLKDLLGIPVSVKETMLQLTDLPLRSEVKEQAKTLPAIYRRMFSSDPLINREFMVGFGEELKALHHNVARWQAGRATSVIIAGPDGSGKSSLINSFVNELDPPIKIKRFVIGKRLRKPDDLILLLETALDISEHSATLDQLISQLLKGPQCIVLMEQAHQLMLRSIGGREVSEALFYVIMATRTHLMWMLSSRYYAWKRLEYLLNAQQYFTHVAHTRFLGKDALREALMLRQRATGLNMLFSDEGLNVPRIRTLRQSHSLESPLIQEILADRYFSTLYALSGGSMTAALFYWLQTQKVGAEGKIMVMPCTKFDDRFIKNLARLYLLTLAEILSHGTLTPEEHGVIFRMDGMHSRLMLDYLCEISLVEMHEADDNGQFLHYGINPVFYHPVSSSLESLNILY